MCFEVYRKAKILDLPIRLSIRLLPSGIPRRGLGGLEPLPLAYDLRNKRQKASQYAIFNKKRKILCLPDPSPLPTPAPRPLPF